MEKVSWRYALARIAFSIVFMLAMLLSPEFAALVNQAGRWWRDAKFLVTLVVIGACAVLWVLSVVLMALSARLRGRADEERIRRGEDVSAWGTYEGGWSASRVR